jgi:hypothetical protein
MTRRYLLAMLGLLVFVVGCPPPPEPPIIKGPTDSRPEQARSDAEILETIRANESKLNRALWSSDVVVVAHINDKKGDEHTYNLEGTMLFQRPRNLLINLRPGLGDNVMQVGSNETEYWAWIEPELSQMWWGRHAYAGRSCAEDVFVNPSELVAAMGIGLPRGMIGPLRKFGNHADLLHYGRQTEDGSYQLTQEYRVMRAPPYLVDVVVFYDEYGRKAMTASLDDFREAWDGGPLLAHQVSVIWPLDKNKLSLRVGSFKNFDESKVKRDAFDRPVDSPPLPPSVYANMIQVDAACDRPGDARRRPVEPAGWNDDGTPYNGPVVNETDSTFGPDTGNAPILTNSDDDESAQFPEAP